MVVDGIAAQLPLLGGGRRVAGQIATRHVPAQFERDESVDGGPGRDGEQLGWRVHEHTRVDALPYAIFVSAGNDGTGAVSSIERIALGYRWKQCAEPLIVKGDLSETDRHRCAELGQTLAAGLALGVL